MRWSTVIPRDTLYDIAALALRLALGGLFAHHAWRTIEDDALAIRRLTEFRVPAAGETAMVLPHLELACATAFALGMLTPLAGAFLAVLGGGALWLELTTEPPLAPDAAPAFLILAIAACLPPIMHTGRLAVDHLAFARPTSPRHRLASDRSSRDPETSTKRPEQAPPLPYPEERAAYPRPSRT
ncbi:putative membrane protein YphA (DoxX/SURF4 family) [Lipingzhangella halophila]|uniref:Putative membrane protein YphA (DoxX/SURF4 family) n=1 Tax=Lipingzhangella halophila TaxID=1783352 RepID=A0A7W7RJF2_9ACTN|nr:DoxX family membrane protein [Lipingzhangella halophila]MBB4933109.1 putative membrane protein YphA (DoxX/SURF4 family) [Lipingzhangella halophila]